MNRHVLLRLFIGIVLPAAIFSGFATLLQNAVEIQLLNSIRLALASGVLVAYLPPVLWVLFSPQPLERSDGLAFGIVYSWMAAFGAGVWWVAFQLMGRPPEMSNNDFVAATIFLSSLGAIWHLATPGALDRRVPPRRWAIIGALVAAGVLMALLIFDAQDIRMRFQGFMALHDWQSKPRSPPR